MTKMPYSGRLLDLSRMHRLLELLDNPHSRLRVIHIAGTKGKGSTAALLSAALGATNIRCGVYTSPHLHYLEERFVLAGAPCSPEKLADLVDLVRPSVRQLDEELGGNGPTYFEIATAMAFAYFAREQVDVAVFEVGLGGRLDSTNVCHPLVSVITSISFDHTKQLGNTLVSIAREKAGIIKPGVPVISGAVDPEAKSTIAAVARERGCVLRQLGDDFAFRYQPPCNALASTTSLLHFDVRNGSAWRPALESIPLGLLGTHQAANAALAIATLRELPEDLTVGTESIRRGFEAASCPARIEVLHERPLTIVDAAHNVASVEALVAVLNECFPRRNRTLLLATTRGKDVKGMLRVLLPEFTRIVCSRYLNNPRASDPQKLCALASDISQDLALNRAPQIDWAPDPASAWKLVARGAQPNDLICVTGSFFIAAEIRELNWNPPRT